MEEQLPEKQVPPQQTCIVRALISGLGSTLKEISQTSESVAGVYKELSADLPDHLTAPTISRMTTGSGLKKLKRRNLLLLHLTVHCLREAGAAPKAPSRGAVAAANEFADAVLLAGSRSVEPESSFYNRNDPRHHRAADSFGSYGTQLIEKAVSRADASACRKLAVLQFLSGNVDDARYWNDRAVRTAAAPLEALSADAAAREAFVAGRWYLYNRKQECAETYLSLAAEAGHADSAFWLGDMLEALQRDDESQRWFSVAWSNGHSGAYERIRPGSE
ncbi:hypothetical protein [Actinomadura litoris]|uniref:hypothetical protein n=1 Tax=Actinomadura litoris TaxID=2678616 RepID=UPI001FA7791B|nr:hypothetical protein [Actinomadura litoris]